MNSPLPPELAVFVQQKIDSGEFENTDDAIFQGLRLLQQRDRRLSELRREIAPAVEELDSGEGEPLDMNEIKQDLRRRLGDEGANC